MRSAVVDFGVSVIGQAFESGSVLPTEKPEIFEDSSAQAESPQIKTQAAKSHKKLMDRNAARVCLSGIRFILTKLYKITLLDAICLINLE